MKKNFIPFYVIVDNINKEDFEKYDVMQYFINCYKDSKKQKREPKNFEEFKKFVEDNSKYMFWCRCEYELVLKPWVGHKNEKKIDVHWQIMNNLDIVTEILIKNVVNSKK